MTDDEQAGQGATAKGEPNAVHGGGGQVAAGARIVAEPADIQVEYGRATASAGKQTWRDWQADDPVEPGELITRDELIRRLVEKGVDVDEDDLVYWQRRGVIPYGERQWSGRVAHAYYPPWMADVIQELRSQQRADVRLKALRPHLLDFAKGITAKHHALSGAAHATSSATGVLSVGYSPIEVHMMEIARVYERNGAPRIARAEVRLVDERGNVHFFAVELSRTTTNA